MYPPSDGHFGFFASLHRTKRAFLGCVLFLAAVASATAAPLRVLTLRGTATNITAEATGTFALVLSIEGEKVSATMNSDAPLNGSGRLVGRYVGGWCELKGQLVEGFQFQLRGVFNEHDFRGTYLISRPGEPVQYGKFQLTPELSTPAASAK